ncbi:MAG TPA: hypothetical protein VFB22_05020 [Candidatus Baltobacteraceae bacterium]|nr:hypothetical protein [Candidatus Baltobacteraceae bacterium]
MLGELEEALEAMRKTDPELHAIVELVAETGMTLEELMALRGMRRFALEGGALRVPTHEGVSVLALSDRAYMALVHLAIPERQDVHALRGRWFAAVAPYVVPPLERALRSLFNARWNATHVASLDDDIPF